jgi:hypothetical protein
MPLKIRTFIDHLVAYIAEVPWPPVPEPGPTEVRRSRLFAAPAVHTLISQKESLHEIASNTASYASA